MHKKNIFFLLFVFSLVISFFYTFFSYNKFNPFSLKFNNVDTELKFELPEKDSYILNIWNPRVPKAIYFNGRQVFPSYVSNKEETRVAYVIVPVDYTLKGINVLDISDSGKYSVKIRNFFGATKSKNIYILLNSSKFISEINFNFLKFVIVAILVYFLLYFVSLLLAKLDIEIFSLYLISYIPYFLFFCFIFLVSLFSQLRLIMSASAFITISLVLVSIVKIPLLATALFKKNKFQQNIIYNEANSAPGALSQILSGSGDLSELLIFLFMWCILFTAITLISGLDMLSEFIINIAYVVLVIAVGMKIFKKLKITAKSSKDRKDSTQEFPNPDLIRAQKTGPIDVYEIMANPIKPEVSE
ncbi:MAG: hypothetical protein Q7J72_03265 [Candidatus Omnitrophota bacterium]|nr:hypothetical protein [Candidatus Omnitrophota bacterium]